MATIIQQPDPLSLSRNIKRYVFGSYADISFRLDRGAVTVLSETYSPDPDGRVTIDVQDVVARYLYLTLPTSDNHTQLHATETFTAYLDGTSIGSFRAVLGGVRDLATYASQFLSSNFLTWQPQTKSTVWDAPEYLSYYFIAAGTLKAKFYLKDGSTSTISVGTGSSATVHTFLVSFSKLVTLSGLDPDDMYGLVDLWVEAASTGSRLSYIQRLVAADTQGDEHFYIARNSLGGLDTFTFHGSLTLAPETAYEQALSDTVKEDVSEDHERRWQQNTGYLSTLAARWAFELIAAPAAWAVLDGAATAIVIDASSLQVSDHDTLHACTFNYTLASEGRLLNLPRTAGTLPALEVPSPTGELFFLELRLSDYPDAALDGTLLLLMQSPASQTWYKASLEAIKALIKSEVLDSITFPSPKKLTLSYGAPGSNPESKTYDGSAAATALIPSSARHLSDAGSLAWLQRVPDSMNAQLKDAEGNAVYPLISGRKLWGNDFDGSKDLGGPLTFTPGSSPSASAHLEVITVGGIQYLHTRLPFYTDGALSSGVPGSSGGSGGGSVVRWSQIQGTGVKIAEITIDGVTTDVYAPEGGSDVEWQTSQYSGYAGLKVGGADARQVALYGHNHDGRYSLASHDHDSRYYLKTEVDTALEDYVTLNTGQSIPGQKAFSSRILADGGLRVWTGSVLTTNHGDALRLNTWLSGNDVAGQLLPVAGSVWSLGTAANRWAAIFGDQIYIPARSSAIQALFDDGSAAPIFRVYTNSETGTGDVNFGIDPGQGNSPTHDVNFVGRGINFRTGNYADANSTAITIAPNEYGGGIYFFRRVLPNADGTLDLGSGSSRWNAVYAKTVSAETFALTGGATLLTSANWKSYVGNSTANKVMYAANADAAETATAADFATTAGAATESDRAAYAVSAGSAGTATEADHAASADSATNASQLGGVAASSYMLKVSGATAGNVALFTTGGGLRDSGIHYSGLALLSGNNTFTGANTFTYCIDAAGGVDITGNALKIKGDVVMSADTVGPLLIGYGTQASRNIQYYASGGHYFSIHDTSADNPGWNPIFYIDRDYIHALRPIIPETGSSSGEQADGIDLGLSSNRWRNIHVCRWYPNGSGGPYIEYDSSANAFKVTGNMYVTGYFSAGYTGTNDVQSAISYSLVPTQASTYDLGSALKPFRTLYAATIGSGACKVQMLKVEDAEADSLVVTALETEDAEITGSLSLPYVTLASGFEDVALNVASGSRANLSSYFTAAVIEGIVTGKTREIHTPNYTLLITGWRKNGSYYDIYAGKYTFSQYSSSSWEIIYYSE